MRIITTNFGTTGDLRPMLALAVELRTHGHQVEMAFSPNHGAAIREYGFMAHAIGDDVSAEQRRVNLEWAANPETVDHHKILEPITRGLPQAFEQLRAACVGADLLISGQAMPAARMVHELTGIPFVSVQFGHFGGSGTPEFQRASDALINPFRVSLGLPRLADPLTKDTNSPQLALHAISRHVLRRPTSWPGHFHIVGYFFLEEAVEEGFPDLEAFFEAGEKPVIITFGSMSDDDPEELTDLFVDAIERVGCRAVIQQDWASVAPRELPETICPVGFVPHTWLLPRGSCVVHHGGSGTTAAACVSGVPSVFVPHGSVFDQFYLGILAEELGIAGKAIPQTELTASWLSAALRNLLDNPSYAQTAQRLGAQIRAEQGVQKARGLIEGFAARLGLAVASGQTTARQRAADDRRERLEQRRAQQRARRRA